MRNKEFEKVYQESTEGNLKPPPNAELRKKSQSNAQNSYEITRRSLADQIKRQSAIKSNYSHQNVESLNSSRSYKKPNKPRSSVLVEKDIPDEGNAQKPDMTKAKINDFHGTGRKTKNIFSDNNMLVRATGKKLNFNTSFETGKPAFKAAGSDFKYRYRNECKENLEIPESDHRIHSDSKWNFWNTLKNPLQWLGLGSEHSSTPNKLDVDTSLNEVDNARNRSISYHPQNKFKYQGNDRDFRFVKSYEKGPRNEMKKTYSQKYGASEDKYGGAKSLRFSKSIYS